MHPEAAIPDESYTNSVDLIEGLDPGDIVAPFVLQ